MTTLDLVAMGVILTAGSTLALIALVLGAVRLLTKEDR